MQALPALQLCLWLKRTTWSWCYLSSATLPVPVYFSSKAQPAAPRQTTHQINKEAYRYNNQWLERSLYTVNTDGAFTYTNQGGAGSHSQTMVIRFGYVSNEPYTNGVASTFGDVAGIGAVGPTGNTPPTYLAQYPQSIKSQARGRTGRQPTTGALKIFFKRNQRVHTYLERPPFTNTPNDRWRAVGHKWFLSFAETLCT